KPAGPREPNIALTDLIEVVARLPFAFEREGRRRPRWQGRLQDRPDRGRLAALRVAAAVVVLLSSLSVLFFELIGIERGQTGASDANRAVPGRGFPDVVAPPPLGCGGRAVGRNFAPFADGDDRGARVADQCRLPIVAWLPRPARQARRHARFPTPQSRLR